MFKSQATADIFAGRDSKAARKACPLALHRVARRKLAFLMATRALTALASPPNNRLEALKGDRQGQHSIRINDQYRICFVWTDRATDIEIVDYHD